MDKGPAGEEERRKGGKVPAVLDMRRKMGLRGATGVTWRLSRGFLDWQSARAALARSKLGAEPSRRTIREAEHQQVSTTEA